MSDVFLLSAIVVGLSADIFLLSADFCSLSAVSLGCSADCGSSIVAGDPSKTAAIILKKILVNVES